LGLLLLLNRFDQLDIQKPLGLPRQGQGRALSLRIRKCRFSGANHAILRSAFRAQPVVKFHQAAAYAPV
jgi:hypothetical protein